MLILLMKSSNGLLSSAFSCKNLKEKGMTRCQRKEGRERDVMEDGESLLYLFPKFGVSDFSQEIFCHGHTPSGTGVEEWKQLFGEYNYLYF